MNADILFRIAAIGVLVTVIAQVLTRAGVRILRHWRRFRDSWWF